MNVPRNISSKPGVWRLFCLPLPLCSQPGPGNGRWSKIHWISGSQWIFVVEVMKYSGSKIVGSSRFKDCSPFPRSNVLRLPSAFRCFFPGFFVCYQKFIVHSFVFKFQPNHSGSNPDSAFVCYQLCWPLYPPQAILLISPFNFEVYVLHHFFYFRPPESS